MGLSKYRKSSLFTIYWVLFSSCDKICIENRPNEIGHTQFLSCCCLVHFNIKTFYFNLLTSSGVIISDFSLRDVALTLINILTFSFNFLTSKGVKTLDFPIQGPIWIFNILTFSFNFLTSLEVRTSDLAIRGTMLTLLWSFVITRISRGFNLK